jgi:hypothetical protein
MRMKAVYSEGALSLFEEVRTEVVLVGEGVVLEMVGVAGRDGGRGETCGWEGLEAAGRVVCLVEARV